MRPLISIPDSGGLTALLDTGADISIWTGSEEDLKKLNAMILNKDLSHEAGVADLFLW